MHPRAQAIHALPDHLDHHPLLTALCQALDVRQYCEIGVQEGKSLAAALDAGTIQELTLMDPWGDTHGGTGRRNHEHIHELLAAHGYAGSVQYHDTVSWRALPGMLVSVSRPHFDLLHIDGDHTYPGASWDMACGSYLTSLMVVHDAHWPDVKLALDEFTRDFPDWVGRRFPAGLGTAVLWRDR